MYIVETELICIITLIWWYQCSLGAPPFGYSADKLRHPRSVVYSLELVLLHKHQMLGGGACRVVVLVPLRFGVAVLTRGHYGLSTF